MTLVRLLKTDDSNGDEGFLRTLIVESAAEKEGGVQVTFKHETEEWGRENFFEGYEIVGVGR